MFRRKITVLSDRLIDVEAKLKKGQAPVFGMESILIACLIVANAIGFILCCFQSKRVGSKKIRTHSYNDVESDAYDSEQQKLQK